MNRKKAFAEIYTPESLVVEMLDKLNEYGTESWGEDETFCDPSCGTGNMLVEVLKRKISLGHDPIKAVSMIYGTDIMEDSIIKCRERLLEILEKNNIVINEKIIKIVTKQIKWLSLKKYPNGALDFNFEFDEECVFKL